MAQPFTNSVARGTRPAMQLIYDLRACGVEREVAIPQVAVIGDQSSGKSSVLEAICSVPLPRGAGLTTRCAIELRLSDIHPDDTDLPSDTAPPERESFWTASIFTSVDSTPVPINAKADLEQAIASKAASLINARHAGGFSNERVIVQIAALGAPNLTIIDLPGIIRTKTFGDFITSSLPFVERQNASSIREVTGLIQGYIRQERTVMLVVVPATQDVATVEALEWASRADPTGHRTIGVITKPDLIDDGAEREVGVVLSNKRKPLKLGYVMVKNRSQREVEDNVSVQAARRSEAEFFDRHKVFSSMPKSLFGVENLVKKVTDVLVARVYDALPGMRDEISTKLDKTKKELKELGRGAGDTPAEASMTLMRIVFEYNNLLTETSAGRYVDKRLWAPSLRLCTRVRDLYDVFKVTIESTRPPFEGDSNFLDEVENDIRNSRARELPGFLNPRIFEGRVARYVEEWREASNKLVSEVRKSVSEVATEILGLLAPEFPGLRHKMHDLIGDVLKKLENEGRSEISALFDREVGQPFTMNDQFLTAVNEKRLERFDQAVHLAMSRAGRDNRGNVREKTVTDMLRAWYQSYYCSGSQNRLRAEAEDMATMLGCYWDVSAKRFVDNHVMVVDTSLLRPLAQAVHVPMNELVVKVGTSQKMLDNLLREDPDTVSRRRLLMGQRERLTRAQELIDRF